MARDTDNPKIQDDLPQSRRTPDPNRFTVSKGTLRIDAFMTRFIFFGGLGVIATIFGIFLFILAEIIPLFQGAEVSEFSNLQTNVADPILIGTDEWTEYPFILSKDGTLHFFDLTGENRGKEVSAPISQDNLVSSATYDQNEQLVALGLSNGTFLSAHLSYTPTFKEDGSRTIDAKVKWMKPEKLGNGSIIDLSALESPTRKTYAGILKVEDTHYLRVNTYIQKRSLFGASGFTLDDQSDLTEKLSGHPIQVIVGANAESLVVRCANEEIHYFKLTDGEWSLRQTFKAFDAPGSNLASMNFIHGRVSLSFTSSTGEHVLYSLYRFGESGERIFGQTKTFDPFPGGAQTFAQSSRNKAFLIGNETRLSLRYSTTADVRWEKTTDTEYKQLLISGKFDKILALDNDSVLHLYNLDDPHPEAGFRAFFSKIWYEGQDGPQYAWQSTGGSDDFEPKLSLIPLIVGSFKGTFYALLFAVPIALLGAIYTSQFLTPNLKRVIKPSMEIMASLPSVVLGFLGALWLAPLLEDRIPSVILISCAIPLSAILIGYFWNLMPIRFRVYVPMGWEFILFVPIIIIVSKFAWDLGPIFESIAFTTQDPVTGVVHADFRLWWEAWTGGQFQQRNSMIVGFMMGFAVIPIIYTITEDALSAVPTTMTSASLALGASRWQTTARIVLPTASAGIFSACMIGLGRAVGETMIVVMATGNTPILDFDIFSGMRTLSANIAVELPEAPHGGTLYRTLFLGAFVLFILTFMVNTLAETLRHRLREKYKVIN